MTKFLKVLMIIIMVISIKAIGSEFREDREYREEYDHLPNRSMYSDSLLLGVGAYSNLIPFTFEYRSHSEKNDISGHFSIILQADEKEFTTIVSKSINIIKTKSNDLSVTGGAYLINAPKNKSYKVQGSSMALGSKLLVAPLIGLKYEYTIREFDNMSVNFNTTVTTKNTFVGFSIVIPFWATILNF